ncbi:MAG UNVERIFIED_CONTAM: hypothetical protein LVQ98_05695 [Rickettsiaceae bacterium]|jgi:hypothetical protein
MTQILITPQDPLSPMIYTLTNFPSPENSAAATLRQNNLRPSENLSSNAALLYNAITNAATNLNSLQAIQNAIANSDNNALATLLSQGLNPNIGWAGKTALWHATETPGDSDEILPIVQTLLAYGANTNITNGTYSFLASLVGQGELYNYTIAILTHQSTRLDHSTLRSIEDIIGAEPENYSEFLELLQSKIFVEGVLNAEQLLAGTVLDLSNQQF